MNKMLPSVISIVCGLCLSLFLLIPATALAGKWKYEMGKGRPLCDAMLRQLNSGLAQQETKKDSSGVCHWGGAIGLTGISEPAWVELNPLDHQELIFRLMAYSWSGGKRVSVSQKSEDMLRTQVRQFLESGGRVQLWRTRLLNDFYNKNHPELWAPPGVQNVVQLRFPERTDQVEARKKLCPIVQGPLWTGSTFIANDALTDVHPDIGAAGFALMRKTLVLYNKEPYLLIGGDRELVITRDAGSGPSPFCELRRSISSEK